MAQAAELVKRAKVPRNKFKADVLHVGMPTISKMCSKSKKETMDEDENDAHGH